MGFCLSAHWRCWQALGAKFWVLSVLRDSYRILFKDSPPPLARTPISFPTSRPGSPRSLALCQVVVVILSMTALEIILDPDPGLSCRHFLMEKIVVAWCPVIVLSHLNKFVLQSPFMLENVASVLLSIREGDFLASITLSDACFLCSIFRIRGSFSWFLSDGVVYQFEALCLGLSTAPQVFTSVFCSGLCVGSVPRDSASRVPNRWLVLVSLEAMAIKSVQDLLSLCHSLGIVIKKQ